MENIETLRNEIQGKVITQQSPEYNEARLNWNPWTSHFPYYIVYPLSENDVKECIVWCKKYDVAFRIRGRVSHSLGYDFSSANRALVCNMQNFTQINNESPNTITIGSGNVLGDFILYLAKDGYMFPYGDIYGLGVAGFIQGGGIGLQNKQMGLASDNILGCKLITANEEVLTVDEKTNSDLYWAVKGGGGGNFGVVTEMTLNYQKAPQLITSIKLVWRGIDLKSIREIIIEWMNTNLYGNINICRNLIMTKENGSTGLFNADISALIYNNDESLFVFKSIGKFVKTVSVLTYYEMIQRNLLPENRSELNYKFLGYFTDKILDDTTVDILINYFNENESDLFFLEMGGNFHTDPKATAFYWRDSILYFETSKIWPPYKDQEIIYDCRRQHQCISSSDSTIQNITKPNFESYREIAYKLGKIYKKGYVNVPNNTYIDPHKYEKFYYGENRRRLRRIKARYDPSNFFNFSQSIIPTTK